MGAERSETPPVVAPLSQLEQAFIAQFVRARGYDPLKLSDLPEHEREALLKDASVYASAKLTEIESRSHFVDEIHHGIRSLHKTGME